MSTADITTVLRLAADAGCDPRTARAYLAGRRVKGEHLRGRLDRARRALGLDSEPPPTAPTPSRAA
jgi:hypothetical protein